MTLKKLLESGYKGYFCIDPAALSYKLSQNGSIENPTVTMSAEVVIIGGGRWPENWKNGRTNHNRGEVILDFKACIQRTEIPFQVVDG